MEKAALTCWIVKGPAAGQSQQLRGGRWEEERRTESPSREEAPITVQISAVELLCLRLTRFHPYVVDLLPTPTEAFHSRILFCALRWGIVSVA